MYRLHTRASEAVTQGACYKGRIVYFGKTSVCVCAPVYFQQDFRADWTLACLDSGRLWVSPDLARDKGGGEAALSRQSRFKLRNEKKQNTQEDSFKIVRVRSVLVDCSRPFTHR